MDEIQVNTVKPKFPQRAIDRVVRQLRALISIPEFGRHIQFVAGNTGRGERAPNARLIAVGLRCVDVAVSNLKRFTHHALGVFRLDLEGAEAELGDAGAVVERDGGNSHALMFPPSASRALPAAPRTTAPRRTARAAG